MKTAISIPDPVFQEAEQYARRARQSRSDLYSKAIVEYLARHAPDTVTDALNQVCVEAGELRDPFVSEAGYRALERVPW